MRVRKNVKGFALLVWIRRCQNFSFLKSISLAFGDGLLILKSGLCGFEFLQVPELNSGPLDAIPVNSLVRFRGMVLSFLGQLLLKFVDDVLRVCHLRDHIVEDVFVL